MSDEYITCLDFASKHIPFSQMLAIESKMAKPGSFVGWFGVLNRCAVFVAFTYILIGFMGYWRYGDYVAASITLNIPVDEA